MVWCMLDLQTVAVCCILYRACKWGSWNSRINIIYSESQEALASTTFKFSKLKDIFTTFDPESSQWFPSNIVLNSTDRLNDIHATSSLFSSKFLSFVLAWVNNCFLTLKSTKAWRAKQNDSARARGRNVHLLSLNRIL